MEGEWVECIVDKDYQIFSEFPYPIRKKGSDNIIKEHITNAGYVECCLNRKPYSKHRIIAIQFIPNPNNLPYIDHIDRQKTNNHVSNLRWVNNSTNQFNKSSNMGVGYEFFEELPNISDVIPVEDYVNHKFTNYWFNPVDNYFYSYNQVIYRRLHICHNAANDKAFVNVYLIVAKIFVNACLIVVQVYLNACLIVVKVYAKI